MDCIPPRRYFYIICTRPCHILQGDLCINQQNLERNLRDIESTHTSTIERERRNCPAKNIIVEIYTSSIFPGAPGSAGVTLNIYLFSLSPSLSFNTRQHSRGLEEIFLNIYKYKRYFLKKCPERSARMAGGPCPLGNVEVGGKFFQNKIKNKSSSYIFFARRPFMSRNSGYENDVRVIGR